MNHPLSPKGRREYLGIAKPVKIGNDVWIGGSCTILPGVTIGNVVGGVPEKIMKEIENDLT